MTKLNKVLSIILVGAITLTVGGSATKTAKADTSYKGKYTAETMKSDNKDIVYHWCTFYTDCDDNSVENGFFFLVKDQDGEVYAFEKYYSDCNYEGEKFLVVTKYDKKNVISAYAITYSGLLNLMPSEPVSHINREIAGGTK